MARVLKKMLEGMGFTNIHTTHDATMVLDVLKSQPIDFLITEWNIDSSESNGVIKRIRRDPLSPNPTLPIIMLTGRAEHSDVLNARDLGINEYVVKPFSAKSIYARLERLVEMPRDFVVSPNFIGPERRSKRPPPPGVADRRKIQPKPHKGRIAGKSLDTIGAPQIWEADFGLKEKIGLNTPLSSIITPEILNQAQVAIAAIAGESSQWIKESLSELIASHKDYMKESNPPKSFGLHISNAALSLSSRAGTFGYQYAAQVAYMLHLFCRNRLDPHKPIHCIIVEKHIEVLQVALSGANFNITPAQNEEILAELRHLLEKYGS